MSDSPSSSGPAQELKDSVAEALTYKMVIDHKIDEGVIHEVMLAVGGVKSQALKVLRDSGVNISDSTFYEIFESNPVLKTIWSSSAIARRAADDEIPALLPDLLAKRKKQTDQLSLQQQENYILAHGPHCMGLSEEQMNGSLNAALITIATSSTDPLLCLMMRRPSAGLTLLTDHAV